MRNVYDFDDTILRGDATALFCRYALMRRPKLFWQLPGVAWAFFLMAINKRGKTEAKEALFRAILPSLAPVEPFVQAFWNRYEGRVKAFYLAQRQPDDVVASASPAFLLEPICQRLGIAHLVASPVDPATGRYLGPNCDGAEKRRRFRAAYGDEPFVFYTDSLSDLPMMLDAQAAFLVRGERVTPYNPRGLVP